MLKPLGNPLGTISRIPVTAGPNYGLTDLTLSGKLPPGNSAVKVRSHGKAVPFRRMANPIALGESDVGPPGGTKDNVARIPRRLLLRHPVPVLFEAIKNLAGQKPGCCLQICKWGRHPGV